MQTYSEFRPTPFDSRGLALSGKQDWLVVPVIQTRDSGILDRCNFGAALDMLGGESSTVEIHRFHHWGPGWFEIIIVDPNSKEAEIAITIERRLSDYPSLDDDMLSEMQLDEAYAWWEAMGLRERIQFCYDHRLSIFAARRDDELPDDDTGEIIDDLAPLC